MSNPIFAGSLALASAVIAIKKRDIFSGSISAISGAMAYDDIVDALLQGSDRSGSDFDRL